jgi:1-pyrroline-5-carboxylate dehydrogenase
VHRASPQLINTAIEGAIEARRDWEELPWEHRAAVFLRAADFLSTEDRNTVLAATMIGQGKTVYQAEIDAAAEAADFFRFGVHFADEIYRQQPEHHSSHVWNRINYRPLEGFVAAIPPFNFTAIAANLGACPAIMGNCVLWKPSDTAVLSNFRLFEILKKAGVPDGIIQFLPADGPLFGDVVLRSHNLAAVNFTGSTRTFNTLWQEVAQNLNNYKTYPRIIGECGGKNFHWLHPSADVPNVVNGTLRSAFEYQGQKCSVCSRIYVPRSLWPEVRDGIVSAMESVTVGQPDDYTSFMSAVIDKRAYDKITTYINNAKTDTTCDVLHGGDADDSRGYFVQPTFIQVHNHDHTLLKEEIFGPVLTAYVYEDNEWEQSLEIVNNTSPYGLTGSVYASDRYAIDEALHTLRHAAGNIYINAKSTGSVVGQQPFGGARRSGTNDKAGSQNYMLRFTSVQSAKECLI